MIGAGAGGLIRGDVDRLDALSLGPVTFAAPVASYSRDTSGIFTLDYPEAIIGASSCSATESRSTTGVPACSSSPTV